MRKRWRRLKFKSRIRRQKALMNITRLLNRDGHNRAIRDPNTVIAYGAGSFNATSRGHGPMPYKELYHTLKQMFIVC